MALLKHPKQADGENTFEAPDNEATIRVLMKSGWRFVSSDDENVTRIFGTASVGSKDTK